MQHGPGIFSRPLVHRSIDLLHTRILRHHIGGAFYGRAASGSRQQGRDRQHRQIQRKGHALGHATGHAQPGKTTRTLAERNGSQRLSIQTSLLQQLLGHGQKTFSVVAATLMAQFHKRNTRLGARQQGQFTEIGGSLQGKNMCIHRAILV